MLAGPWPCCAAWGSFPNLSVLSLHTGVSLLEAVGVKWLSRVKLWVSAWRAAGAGAFAVQWEKRMRRPSQQTLGVKKLPPPDPLKETLGAAPKGI